MAQDRLGVELREWIRSHRDQGYSWDSLARLLERVTGVVVTGRTLARWID